jgi:asparagine synthase (glutamine-hydrolysing)
MWSGSWRVYTRRWISPPRWLRAKYTLTELSLDSAIGYFRTVTKVHHDTRRALFAPAVLAALDGYDPGARIQAAMDATDDRDPLRQAQITDIDTYLVGDILTKVDRASMANSLEVRAPLLDHRFVEWGLGLPPGLKLHGGTGKYVFRRAMEDRLPAEVLYRPKQGFATSLAGLFRANAEVLRARLQGQPMQDCGLFRGAAIARLLDEHDTGRIDHSHVLWLLLVFEGFLHACNDATPVRAAEPAMA